MVVYGTVVDIAIDVAIKKRAGGTYQGYRLTYKTQDGEIKTLEKTSQSLKYAPSVDTALRSLSVGDDFTLTMEKNESNFWEVKSLSKGKLASEDLPNNPTPLARNTTEGAAPKGKVLGSTYETPEERKLKQRLIVRQSSFAQAQQFLNNDMDTLEAVLSVAEQIENWVYRGL